MHLLKKVFFVTLSLMLYAPLVEGAKRGRDEADRGGESEPNKRVTLPVTSPAEDAALDYSKVFAKINLALEKKDSFVDLTRIMPFQEKSLLTRGLLMAGIFKHYEGPVRQTVEELVFVLPFSWRGESIPVAGAGSSGGGGSAGAGAGSSGGGGSGGAGAGSSMTLSEGLEGLIDPHTLFGRTHLIDVIDCCYAFFNKKAPRLQTSPAGLTLGGYLKYVENVQSENFRSFQNALGVKYVLLEEALSPGFIRPLEKLRVVFKDRDIRFHTYDGSPVDPTKIKDFTSDPKEYERKFKRLEVFFRSNRAAVAVLDLGHPGGFVLNGTVHINDFPIERHATKDAAPLLHDLYLKSYEEDYGHMSSFYIPDTIESMIVVNTKKNVKKIGKYFLRDCMVHMLTLILPGVMETEEACLNQMPHLNAVCLYLPRLENIGDNFLAQPYEYGLRIVEGTDLSGVKSIGSDFMRVNDSETRIYLDCAEKRKQILLLLSAVESIGEGFMESEEGSKYGMSKFMEEEVLGKGFHNILHYIKHLQGRGPGPVAATVGTVTGEEEGDDGEG